MWALGVVLYELAAAGKRPFEVGGKNGGGMRALVLAVCRGQFPPLERGYSDGLRALVASLLARNPRARPEVAGALARARSRAARARSPRERASSARGL